MTEVRDLPRRTQPSVHSGILRKMTGHAVRCLTTLILLGLGSIGVAEESPDFERQILPLLYNRCFSCHSEKSAEPRGGLRLDSATAIRESGVVLPGQPDESELLIRTSLPHTDESLMPPLKGGSLPLNEAELALLRRWIAGGAQTGTWEKFNHRESATIVTGDRLKKSDVPRLTQQIDQLVEKYHTANGTKLNPPTGDETFLRRVFLDVAGRIPSLKESTEFLTDTSPDKRSRLIDALLASEAYVSHTFNWKADQLRLVTRGFPGQPGWMYDDWVKNSIRSGMPYDEFVRQLVTAEGYLWENGAVGFYQRDLGMPLDHMSNLTRLFLGTRMECAQCHDHPFEPITQQDFYQLTAYTFGVSNLYSAAGYTTDSVRHWNELQSRLNDMDAPEALRQCVSMTVAPLKRLTTDTEHQLTYPETYIHDPQQRGKVVVPRTLFGDEAPVTSQGRRIALAQWMTSPRNPRFARNIANRLWKRVMGTGLIEPVDSLSPVNRPECPELLDCLSEMIVQLGFDERAYLAAVLNTRLYQSESIRTEAEPNAPLTFLGPQLRRLSAEQAWDSLLVLLVEDLDERKGYPNEQVNQIRKQWGKLTTLDAEQLLEQARLLMEARITLRRCTIGIDEQKLALRQAQQENDSATVERIQKLLGELNEEAEQARDVFRIKAPAAGPERDPRWTGLSTTLVRAAEIPTPISLGHFLRQFGQSDRREIDAFNTSANVTHALALMNGELSRMTLQEGSYLREELHSFPDGEHRAQAIYGAIYRAILVRSPAADEAEQCRQLWDESPTPEADLIWALLNTPEFLFIQ